MSLHYWNLFKVLQFWSWTRLISSVLSKARRWSKQKRKTSYRYVWTTTRSSSKSFRPRSKRTREEKSSPNTNFYRSWNSSSTKLKNRFSEHNSEKNWPKISRTCLKSKYQNKSSKSPKPFRTICSQLIIQSRTWFKFWMNRKKAASKSKRSRTIFWKSPKRFF